MNYTKNKSSGKNGELENSSTQTNNKKYKNKQSRKGINPPTFNAFFQVFNKAACTLNVRTVIYDS